MSVDSIADGGFNSVTFGGNVLFKGPVTMNLPGSIKVATGGVLSADSTVDLTASYIALGRSFVAPLSADAPERLSIFDPAQASIFAPPSWGKGSLSVHANLIDVGNLSLQHIGTALLDASGGSIRGDGTFAMAGALTMKAAQIFPATGTTFEVTAYNHDATGAAVTGPGVGTGKIIVQQAGVATLPLSAGGILSLYADSISQGGTLVAPFGRINLGWDGTGQSPVDPVSGIAVPKAKLIALKSGSVTAVSGLDTVSGNPISVPYGTTKDGKLWTDPSGANISTTGLPPKSVNVSGDNLITEAGSLIDLRGGGDVTASQWVAGTGGKINLAADPSIYTGGRTYAGDLVVDKTGTIWSATQDSVGKPPGVGLYWSKVSQSYAIIPGYQPDYSPTGYSDGSLALGSKIKLTGGAGLPAGNYTLLPASYATQPGAYLITPLSASRLAGSITQPDGSVTVSGSRFNALESTPAISGVTSLFKISSPTQVASMAKYNVISADAFFKASPTSSRPSDAAYLLLNGSSDMSVNGAVRGWAAPGGHGALVDISSTKNFLITGNSSSANSANSIVLNSSLLSGWNVGSLLIGGIRIPTSTGSSFTMTPSVSQIVVDNSGSILSAGEVILAAKNEVTLKNGASVEALGAQDSSPLQVAGNGALLRVSGDFKAVTTRTRSDASAVVGFQIGDGVKLSGTSITLDSSGRASIASSAVLDAQAINLTAGRIALNFDSSPTAAATLNLSGNVLAELSKARSLNLTSYSSIDFLGSGILGSPLMEFMGLHAGALLGDNKGSDLLMASSILLDNANGSTDPNTGLPYVPSATAGALSIAGNQLTLGYGMLGVGGFQNVTAKMTGGIQGSGIGMLSVAGNLNLSAPIFTAASGANTSIIAGGALKISGDSGGPSVSPGLGAILKLKGTSVDISTPILLPSGSLSVESTTGNLTITSLLDVGGTSRQFFDTIRYTDAGSIVLTADNGNIDLTGGGVNLGAQAAAGSAGILSIIAPNGTVSLGAANINAVAPSGGAGSFAMDVNGYNGGNLSNLENTLTTAGLSSSRM